MKCAKCGGNLATNGGLCETCARWKALEKKASSPYKHQGAPGEFRFDLSKYIADMQLAIEFVNGREYATVQDIVEWAQKELISPVIVEMMFNKVYVEDLKEDIAELTQIYGGLDTEGKITVLYAAYREKQRMAAPEVSNA